MDFKSLLYKISQPIADINIGKRIVYLYALTTSDMSSIRRLANNQESLLENLKSIVQIISSLKKTTKSNLDRVALTAEFINDLSQADLNKLAEAYLETSYLKNIHEELKNPLQRNPEEEGINYLYRLLTKYVTERDESYKEDIKRALDPFHNVRQASLNISKQINTYDFSSPAIEHARTAQKQRVEELELTRVTAEMTKESTKLLNALANDVTKFLLFWYEEAEKNNKTTEEQLRIAVITLVISVCLSVASLIFSYLSYTQDMTNNDSNNMEQQKSIELISENNKNISRLTEQGSDIERHLTEIIKNQQTALQQPKEKSQKITE